MSLNIRHMETFRAVMVAGSMNGAAKLLNVSQPAISRTIAHAEQELGFLLFDRVRGKLVPTREAKLLSIEVERLHEQMSEVERLATEIATRPSGNLSVVASPSIALGFTPGVIASFHRQYPDVRLRYRTSLMAEMPRDLLSGSADLAISVLPLNDPNLMSEPLAKGRMVCLLPAGHRLTEKPTLSLLELASHPLISYDLTIPFGRLISQAFARLKVSPRIAIEIPRAELAMAMVREGMGYALIDRSSLSALDLPGLIVRPLKEEIPLEISVTRSRFSEPSLHVKAFAKILKQAATADHAVKDSPLWVLRKETS